MAPVLVIRTQDGRVLFEAPLADRSMVLGRDSKCDVVLDRANISSRHAVVAGRNGKIFIRDLDSRNGVFRNGTRLPANEDIEVPEGTQLSLGSLGEFSLCVRAGPEDTLALAGRVSLPVPARPPSPPPTIAPSLTPVKDVPLAVPDGSTNEESDFLELAALKKSIRTDLFKRLDLKESKLKEAGTPELRRAAREVIEDIVRQLARDRIPSGLTKAELIDAVLKEALGLGPLEDLLADPGITEIMVNGKDRVWIERGGKLTLTRSRFVSNEDLLLVIERIVSSKGRRIDEQQPYVDTRLDDGSRVNAIIPPLALDGPSLTIRKFPMRRLAMSDLIEFGALSPPMGEFLRICVESRQSIIVSGGTGSGKTTLLNVLSSWVPQGERIVTIEDSAELRLNLPHVVRLEARPPNIEGQGAITIRQLVVNALRMRPDRIVIGECRSGEALDMLQAMNTGHEGSLTTVHANACRDALARLETMCMWSGVQLPARAIREQIRSAVNIVVQVARLSDGKRKVVNIAEITGMEGDLITMQENIFSFRREGIGPDGKVLGKFVAGGTIPRFVHRLREAGMSVPLELFAVQG